jgi:tetratricopeptide (TPR) repeat protein
MGNLTAATGDLDGAEQFYARVARAADAAVAARPGDLRALRDLGVQHTKRAQMHNARGRKREALDHYRQFSTVAEKLLAADPDDLVTQRDAAIGRQWIGILLLETGKPDDAIEPLASALTLFEKLWRADAENADACLSLAATYSRLGEAQSAAGQLDASGQSHRHGLEISDQMRKRWADHPGVERHYGVALYKMFEHHKAVAERSTAPAERTGQLREACEWLARCRGWFADLQQRGRLDASDANTLAELTGEFEQHCGGASNAAKSPTSAPAD